jgi:hypothetical protein
LSRAKEVITDLIQRHPCSLDWQKVYVVRHTYSTTTKLPIITMQEMYSDLRAYGDNKAVTRVRLRPPGFASGNPHMDGTVKYVSTQNVHVSLEKAEARADEIAREILLSVQHWIK